MNFVCQKTGYNPIFFCQKTGYNPIAAQKVNCLRSCGNIAVPYPFGLEEGCSARKEFQLKCTNGTSPSLQFDDGHQVTYINVSEGLMGIKYTPQQMFRVDAPKGSGMCIGSLVSSSVQWVFANLTCQEAQQNSSAYGCVDHYSACLGVTSADGNIGYRCECMPGSLSVSLLIHYLSKSFWFDSHRTLEITHN